MKRLKVGSAEVVAKEEYFIEFMCNHLDKYSQVIMKEYQVSKEKYKNSSIMERMFVRFHTNIVDVEAGVEQLCDGNIRGCDVYGWKPKEKDNPNWKSKYIINPRNPDKELKSDEDRRRKEEESYLRIEAEQRSEREIIRRIPNEFYNPWFKTP